MIKQKIKPVLPSFREKKRYLAFEVISKNKIKDSSLVYKSISDSLAKFIGELGMAKAGLIMLKDKWNDDKQRGLIRANRLYIEHLRAALALITKVGSAEAIVRSVGVSGILKKAEARYLV